MHRSTMCGRLDLLPDQLGVVDLRGCVSRICRDGPGMTTRTALLLCVMLLVLRVPVKVFAGPPYITDDPEPVEYQHWEVYLASISLSSRIPGPPRLHTSKSITESCLMFNFIMIPCHFWRPSDSVAEKKKALVEFWEKNINRPPIVKMA